MILFPLGSGSVWSSLHTECLLRVYKTSTQFLFLFLFSKSLLILFSSFKLHYFPYAKLKLIFSTFIFNFYFNHFLNILVTIFAARAVTLIVQMTWNFIAFCLVKKTQKKTTILKLFLFYTHFFYTSLIRLQYIQVGFKNRVSNYLYPVNLFNICKVS